MFDLLHDEDWSLGCRCCLHFRLFSNPHVSNKMLMMMMIIVRNKDNCILNNTAPVPWPSPLTRVVSLDSLSPVLSLAVGYGSWQTPLSWSYHLSPHWTSLWARDSAQSSRARVTSRYSHHIVRFTTHPARKSDNLNRSPWTAKALPLSMIISSCIKTNMCQVYFQKYGIFVGNC